MTTEAVAAAPAKAGAGRLISLDVLRGLTIAMMLLVNNAGDWDHIFRPLEHASWHGCTPTDLVFPFFLFIVGVSIELSFAKRIASGSSVRSLLGHALRRALIIFALGLFLNFLGYLALSRDYFRPLGVLQRIAICYLAAAVIACFWKARGIAVWAVVMLIGYWAVMASFSAPGFPKGDLSQEGNIASYIDTRLLGPHCYIWDAETLKGHDPEGLLSMMPSLGTALLGCLAGCLFLTRWLDARKAWTLAAWGAAGVALGLLWSLVFPLNKNLWTSSYALYTAGLASLLLAASFWLIDIKKIRGWSVPLQAYGANPITAYVAAGVIGIGSLLIKVGPPDDRIFLKSWIYSHLYKSWIEPLAGAYVCSAAYGFSYVLLIGVIMWVMFRKKLIIRI